MTTSGSIDFNLTTNPLIEKMFGILGVGSEGEDLSARQYEDGRLTLNLMFKTWGTKSHLWLRTERSVTLIAGQASYVLTPKPMRVEDVRRKVTASAIETPLNEWARKTYLEQPNKAVQSIPTAYYYDPQSTAGTLYVWPAPSTATSTDMTLQLTYWRRMDDMDASNNDADLPQEWLETIVWNGAARLLTEYPVNDPRLADKIERNAAILMANLEAFDSEPASLYLQPETMG